MLLEHVRTPVALVIVQPVDPDPPAILTSPVAVPFRFRAPVPLESSVKGIFAATPVAAIAGAVPLRLILFEATVNVPVPNEMALLVVVFTPKVPVPVISKIALLPVKLM